MLEPTTQDRRQVRHAATKAEIVSVAWALAQESGLAGLSLRDVAKRVGMQSPSLYSYFDSKNAVYDAMFAEAAADYRLGDAAVELSGKPRADITAVLRFHVAFCTSAPVRHQLLFQHAVPGFVPSAESLAVAPQPFEALRARLSAAGVDSRTADLVAVVGVGIAEAQLASDPSGTRWVAVIDDAAEWLASRAEVPESEPAPKATKKRKKNARK